MVACGLRRHGHFARQHNVLRRCLLGFHLGDGGAHHGRVRRLCASGGFCRRRRRARGVGSWRTVGGGRGSSLGIKRHRRFRRSKEPIAQNDSNDHRCDHRSYPHPFASRLRFSNRFPVHHGDGGRGPLALGVRDVRGGSHWLAHGDSFRRLRGEVHRTGLRFIRFGRRIQSVRSGHNRTFWSRGRNRRRGIRASDSGGGRLRLRRSRCRCLCRRVPE